MDISKYLPTLVSSDPEDGATNVALNHVFELRFSVPLHPSVVTSADLDRFIIISDKQTDAAVHLNLVYPTAPIQTDVVRFTLPGLQPGRSYVITILPDLPAFTGRKAGVTTILDFSTISAASIVPTPQLVEPQDNTQHTDPLQLQWQAVVGSGTYQYEVQVSRDTGFDAGIVWSTTGSATTVTVPVGTLTSREFYYWRVRATDVSAPPPNVSDWSVVWGFYYVSQQDLPSETLLISQLMSEASGTDGFIIKSSLDEYEENMMNSWPPLLFVGDISSGSVQVTFTRRQVDGFPSWNWTPVNFTVSFGTDPDTSKPLMTITPSDPFMANMIYKIVIKQGSKRYVREFVSYYDPFYASPDAVLVLTEGLLGDSVSMHDVNFLIYRRSLDANRHYIKWFPPTSWGMAGPQDSTVRSMRIGHFYAVPRWVEYIVACDLLRRRMMDLAAIAGQNRRLGDYSESNEGYAIQQIRQLLKDLQGQAEMWLAEFSKMRGVIETANIGRNAIPHEALRRIGERNISSRDWRDDGKSRGY
ncbi:MAG: Ig-like domain-containing protein [candidate division WOR-3 bacterium]